jgi:DNA-binding protein WhiA
MYKSVHHANAEFVEKEKFSRAKELQNVYKFVPDATLDYKSVYHSDTEVINREIFQCPSCQSNFMKGLFLTCGTINDPKRSYHLELAVSNDVRCFALLDFLSDEVGIQAKRTVRRGVGAIYIKESSTIEDFMTFIGAPQVTLSIMNVKILRDIRNNENRRTNCDAANIFKSTGAAALQLKAIQILNEGGRMDSLPESLKETARLREENPELSLEELAAKHDPPITKSGLSHRMKKLIDLSKEIS